LEAGTGNRGKDVRTVNNRSEGKQGKVQEAKGLNKSGQSKTRLETDNTRAGDQTSLYDMNGQLSTQGKARDSSSTTSHNQGKKAMKGGEAVNKPRIKSKEPEKISPIKTERQNSDGAFGKTTLFGEQNKDKLKKEEKYALPISKPLFSSSKTKEEKYSIPKQTTSTNRSEQKLKLFEDKPDTSLAAKREIGGSKAKKSNAEKSKDQKKLEQASHSLANFSKKTSVAEVDLSSDQKRNRTEETFNKKFKVENAPQRLETLKTVESKTDSQLPNVSIAKKKAQSSLTNSLSTDKLFKTFDSKIPALNPPKKDSFLYKESNESVKKHNNATESTEIKDTTFKESSKKNNTRNFDSVLKSKEGSSFNQKSSRDLAPIQSPREKVKFDTNKAGNERRG
jgi:hypothetical protein